MLNINLLINSSKILTFILFTTHLITIMCGVLTFKNQILQIIITIFYLGNLHYYLSYYARLKLKKSIINITYQQENIWLLKFNNQQTILVALEKDSIITKNFILLNFYCSKRKKHYSVPIFPDAVNKEGLRKLHCFLLQFPFE